MLEDEKQEHSLDRAQRMREHIVQDLIGDLHRAGTTCVVTVVSAQNVWQDSKNSMTRLQLLRRDPLQIPHTAPIHRRLWVRPTPYKYVKPPRPRETPHLAYTRTTLHRNAALE